jgi:hypothetical protein
MVGLPGEHYNDIVSTVQCITEGLRAYRYDLSKFKNHIYRFVPFPGTRIFATLSSEAASAFPKSAREWGTFIYEKVNDGLEPWRGENVSSMFASTTFYLWKAYLQQESPRSPAGRLLKRIAKFRVDNLFFRLPLEWHVWKKLKAHNPSRQATE